MPDRRRYGMYALVGYRTPWLGIMPYVLFEDYVFGTRELAEGVVFTGGLNVRPIPAVVLTAQFTYATFPGAADGTLGEQPLVYLGLQAAWAF
jgi:hypothetical protein